MPRRFLYCCVKLDLVAVSPLRISSELLKMFLGDDNCDRNVDLTGFGRTWLISSCFDLKLIGVIGGCSSNVGGLCCLMRLLRDSIFPMLTEVIGAKNYLAVLLLMVEL